MIKIGDWVTQYSVGYWKVLNIIPKYADSDYSYNGLSWKKGDRLGNWVILKKGFTPKMKPSNACEFVDGQWCVPVSADIAEAIERAFCENVKAKQKFDNARNMPHPCVGSEWMMLTEEQADAFSERLKTLPERFTLEQFWKEAKDYIQFIVKPSQATHILYLFNYPWEINEAFEPFHFDPELKRLDPQRERK